MWSSIQRVITSTDWNTADVFKYISSQSNFENKTAQDVTAQDVKASMYLSWKLVKGNN